MSSKNSSYSTMFSFLKVSLDLFLFGRSILGTKNSDRLHPIYIILSTKSQNINKNWVNYCLVTTVPGSECDFRIKSLAAYVDCKKS